MSGDQFYRARRSVSTSSASSVAVGFSRRSIALLIAAAVVATFVFVLSSGGRAGLAYAGETPIMAKALTHHECNSTEWHFLINQIDSKAKAPESITVNWAKGGTEVVALSKFTGGVAHYVTTSNLDSTVVSASAEVYAGWSGQFNLSHGPCGGPTPSPTKTETPTPSPTVTKTETPTPSPTVTKTETPTPSPTVTETETPTPSPTVTETETPTPSPTVTKTETPTPTPTVTETETPVPVPTAVPAGMDSAGGGGSSAGLLGLVLVISGAVAGTAVRIVRRRFLHDS